MRKRGAIPVRAMAALTALLLAAAWLSGPRPDQPAWGGVTVRLPVEPVTLSPGETATPEPDATPLPAVLPATTTPTPSVTPAPTPTPSRTPTPALTPSVTASPTARPTRPPAPTATAHPVEPAEGAFVPAAYAGTTLGQAVTQYNAAHAPEITLHVVSADAGGIDGAMYRDLLVRGWRIMGPEDFAASVDKPGWPYLVIARADALDAIAVAGWGYVLDHERVHMVAAANLATLGMNLAELMRRPDGTFTHEAAFHEVCADFYPRDANGNHRPVAAFYGAMQRMPELLRVLDTYGAEQLAYVPSPGYEVLTITGVPLVDTACAWDREAMVTLRALYDQQAGPGAFDALFPVY